MTPDDHLREANKNAASAAKWAKRNKGLAGCQLYAMIAMGAIVVIGVLALCGWMMFG